MTEKQKKSMLIGSLLAVVVLMAIAYAAFASNLTITGTGSVSSNWCIGFDSTRTSDYQATAGISGGDTPTGSMSFSGDSCGSNYKTTASLNASFKQPGDKIEYTLTIGNKGTLPAAIESINVDNQSVTSDTTITKGNIKYIIEMPASTSLAVNTTTTMKVTAMFQNDTEVSGSTNEQQTISVVINAVQDDGNGGFTPTPSSFDGSGTIYRLSSIQLANKGSQAENNGTISSIVGLVEGTDYTTNVSSLGKNYYLKHDVIDNEIIHSYVCLFRNTEYCLEINQYANNKNLLDSIADASHSTGMYDTSYSAHFDGDIKINNCGNFSIFTNSTGDIGSQCTVFNSPNYVSYICSVYSDGSSKCYEQ